MGIEIRARRWNVGATVFLAFVLGIVPTEKAPSLARLAAAATSSAPLSRAKAEAIALRPLQFDPVADRTGAGFVSRGSGYAFVLAEGEALVSLGRRDTAGVPDRGVRNTARPPASALVRMSWVGARPGVSPVGVEPTAGVTNYLVGDPAEWRRDVRSFGKVRYQGVYDGIDLVFYGNQKQLEYDFVVAPGADPDQIRLRFSGDDGIEIDSTGSLAVKAGGEVVLQRAPVLYQLRGGERQTVAGSYERLGAHDVGFAVGDYDHSAPLYIDPVLAFSSFLGGNSYDYPKAVTVDASGNAYVTGYTSSVNFPTTYGTYRSSCPTCAFGTEDVFVTKISGAGALVYSTFIGGSSTADKAHAIALDAAGNVYVTGETYYPGSGPSFPVVNGFNTTAGGGGFLFKLDPAGRTLLYSTLMQSGSSTIGYGVAVEGSNAYVAGMTVAGASFPRWPTSGTFSSAIGPLGTYDGFVVKVDTTKTGAASLAYATRFGGWDAQAAYGVAVNSLGEAYVTGDTSSNNFPTAGTPVQPTCGSDGNCNNRTKDVFVAKLAASGSSLLYSTFVGGSGADTGFGIALDSLGYIYVAGETYSSNFPVTVGAYQTACRTSGGNCSNFSDAFVFQLVPAGNGFVFSTYLGGNSRDAARAIALDAQGNAYVAGDTDSSDFPVTAGAIQPARNGANTDAFVSMLDFMGTTLPYSTYLGGSASVAGGDKAFGIALDSNSDVWVVGQTDSVNFPLTSSAFQHSFGGGGFDGFVARIGDPVRVWVVTPNAASTTGGTSVTVQGTGFAAGAAVSFGGTASSVVNVLNSTTLTAVTPAHAAGTVDVTVTNTDTTSGTLVGGFRYGVGSFPTFTDDPIVPRTTKIKAQHISELRFLINSLRGRYSLGNYTYTAFFLVVGVTPVQAAHIAEMRTALGEAYDAASRPRPAWTDPTIGTRAVPVSAVHIAELRNAVLALW